MAGIHTHIQLKGSGGGVEGCFRDPIQYVYTLTAEGVRGGGGGGVL